MLPHKDLKSNLKEAREAIKRQEYGEVIKLSKAVLKEDKCNYMALIFLGISLQETGPADQAEATFRKAIELNPNNILGWNGLASYYEKHGKNGEQLFNVYCKLLELETIEKKILEYAGKLTEISADNNFQIICEVIYKLLERDGLQESTSLELHILLVQLLMKHKESANELANMFKESLEKIISNTKTVSRLYYGEYLKILHKLEEYEQLVLAAEEMQKLYEDDALSLEWICKVFNDSFLNEPLLPSLELKVNNVCDKLLTVQPNSTIGMISKSILLFTDAKYLESYSLSKKVLNGKPNSLLAWILIMKSSLKLHLFEIAAKAAEMVKKLSQGSKISNEAFLKEVNILLIEAFTNAPSRDKVNQGIELAEKILCENEAQPKVLKHLIFAYIQSKNFQQAEKFLWKLSEMKNQTNDCALLQAKLLHKQEKLKEALSLLANNNSLVAEWWLEMGEIYWDMKEYSKSLLPYLKAAKYDANNYIHFMRLGRYYDKIDELEKARKCYEKAFQINDKDTEVVLELSKIYRKQKKWDSNTLLLQNYVSDGYSSENTWAYLQMGLNFIDQENYTDAIECLRLVTRLNPKNSYCWDSLADAYLERGSYLSALRSYKKANELSPDLLYSQLQIAHVNQVLGHTKEAKKEFEEILLQNHEYVPALKGHAETCLRLAREYKTSHMTGLARDCAQRAIDSAVDAVKIRNISCLWKLIADSVIFIARLPEKYCCAFVYSSLLEENDADGMTAVEKEELYNLAARCYCKALNLVENNTLIWHDLAVCYFEHSYEINNQQLARDMLEKALAIAYKCIKLNPTYSRHWNLIGNIYCRNEMKNYSYAQHFYIQAITVDRNNAITWCNLGTLYLILNELKLANKAFAEAQRIEPNYVNSWIGQALVAESAQHDDAMDLFRHSTQLGFHKEGSIGYAHWVCKTLLNTPPNVKVYAIHNMNAIPVACDALTWYTEKDPYDSCAWNMLGILQERMGLKNSSEHSFRNAFLFCDKEYKDKAKINYARTLVKSGDYSKAIKLYSDIEAATFKSGSGLALALFKAGKYQESYEAYESALHWLTDEEGAQSDLLVALASIGYMFQGPEVAKTLLFQSIQLKPPSPWGFYATLALALKHNDLKLAKLTMKELNSLSDEPECIEHFVALLSYVYLLQDKFITATREVSKTIHRHPDHISAWLTLFLVQLYANNSKSPLKVILRCAKIAGKLGNNAIEVSKILSLTSMAFCLMGNHCQALKMAQKALHCYPGSADAWMVFLTTLKEEKQKRAIFKVSRIKDMIEFVRNELRPKESTLNWLTILKSSLD